jgi:transforming growth factor-beta-induced protein
MKMQLSALIVLAATCLGLSAAPATAQTAENFARDIPMWRTVVDGVMGGRSTANIGQSASGHLLFDGRLSLENNGGFSQIRAGVSGLDGTEAIELRVRGDGRTYKFDIRTSNVRMMAGSFQQDFATESGRWTTVVLPIDDFRLYSFGRLVRNAPQIESGLIDSVGITLSDKQPGPFALEIASIRALGSVTQNAANATNSLGAVATQAGLTTLLELVAATELSLPDGDVTIFAPTNQAFADLPRSEIRRLLSTAGRDDARSILTYHVVPGRLSAADLLSRRTITTANGQRLAVSTDGGIAIGGAGLLAADVPFDGGVVHVIDAVLLPQLDTIRALASSTDALSTLSAAVSAARLDDLLGPENGPWTVFAPANSAFAALPDGTLDGLLDDREALTRVLGLHVVPGRLYADDLLSARRARSLNGEPLRFEISGGKLTVGGAGVIAADIEASNGVVHLIDEVLLPEQTMSTSRSISAEAIRLSEKAISLGAPLFNDGQQGACAAIYEVTIEAMIGLGGDRLGDDVIRRLRRGLEAGRDNHNMTERAWTYRRALDDVYSILSNRERARPVADMRH